MNDAAHKVGAGAIGGLAAGALLSMVMLAMEAAKGEPSDLVKLKRRAGQKLSRRDSGTQMDAGAAEQLVSHGGHLALSIAAGTAYGAANPKRPHRSWRERLSASASTPWPTG